MICFHYELTYFYAVVQVILLKKADVTNIPLKIHCPMKFLYGDLKSQNSHLGCFHHERTPPLWRDLVKILMRKLRHASSFSLKWTDFKKVIFEKIP